MSNAIVKLRTHTGKLLIPGVEFLENKLEISARLFHFCNKSCIERAGFENR
jgi:hypothetical protein